MVWVYTGILHSIGLEEMHKFVFLNVKNLIVFPLRRLFSVALLLLSHCIFEREEFNCFPSQEALFCSFTSTVTCI